MKERATEKDAPEQGPGQFPAQAASAGWLRGCLPTFMSELPSSVRSAVVQDALAVWPLGGQDGGRHLEVAQPCGLTGPAAQRGRSCPCQPSPLRSPFQTLEVGRAALNTPSSLKWSEIQ